MYHQVFIKGLLLDPISNRPILLLEDRGKQRILPIWIGAPEANIIALQLENIPTPRPLTHDLLCQVLESVEGTLKEVRICDCREETYFARIVLTHDGKDLEVDARPSDAVTLALKNRTPIMVSDRVFTLGTKCDWCDNQIDAWLHSRHEAVGDYEM